MTRRTTLKQKLKLTVIAILRGLTPNFIYRIIEEIGAIWNGGHLTGRGQGLDKSFLEFVKEQGKHIKKKRTRSKPIAKKAVPKKKAPAKKVTSEKKPRKPRATKAEMEARKAAQQIQEENKNGSEEKSN